MRIKKYNDYLKEAVNSEVSTFLLDFGMLITMNLAKCEQLAIDENAKRELTSMLSNINKPIINGLKYTEILNDVEFMSNPKMTAGLFKQIDLLIKFIEPRIQKFVKDSDNKSAWLKKISDMKERYKKCINII